MSFQTAGESTGPMAVSEDISIWAGGWTPRPTITKTLPLRTHFWLSKRTATPKPSITNSLS